MNFGAELIGDVPPHEVVRQYYDTLSHFWHPVMREPDLPAKRPIRVTVLGQGVALARLNGKVVALDDACRHFQARLSEGVIEAGCKGHTGEILRCRYHGWAYDGSGRCLEIPQLKEDIRVPSAAQVVSYETGVKYGLIWLCLAPPALHALPDIPEFEKDGMVPTRLEYSDPWRCSVVRMVLSALDDYHFPWLHEGILGTRDQVEAPLRQITREGTTLVSRFTQKQPPNVTNKVSADGGQATVNYEMRVDMPNVIRLIKRNTDGGTYSVCFFPTPHTFNQTGIFWRVIRNYQTSPAEEEAIIKMEQLVQGQDKEHVSLQRPWTMKPLPIKGVDDALIAYLKWLRELGIPDNI